MPQESEKQGSGHRPLQTEARTSSQVTQGRARLNVSWSRQEKGAPCPYLMVTWAWTTGRHPKSGRRMSDHRPRKPSARRMSDHRPREPQTRPFTSIN